MSMHLWLVFVAAFFYGNSVLAFFGTDQRIPVTVFSAKDFIDSTCSEREGSFGLIVRDICAQKRFSFDVTGTIKKLSGRTIWVLAEVASSIPRSAVHVQLDDQVTYLYHSGDGQKQVLVAEIQVNDLIESASITIIPNEEKNNLGPTEWGKIYVGGIAEISEFLKDQHALQSWARNNNPNSDFHFDRYVSLMKNFSITVPNIKNEIWEKYFSLGVDDRFSHGDYFCFPDDKILVLENSGTRHWIYLGALRWTRTFSIVGKKLIVRFEYISKQGMNELMFQSTAQNILKDNFSPRDRLEYDFPGRLTKIYEFETNRDHALVQIQTKLFASSLTSSYFWIVEDGAFMDFQVGTQLGVISAVGYNILQHSFEMRPDLGLFRLVDFIEFRDRGRPGTSLFSFYRGTDADFRFILPMYLPKFLDRNPYLIGMLTSNQSFSTEWPYGGAVFHGLGFKLSSSSKNFTEKFFQMYFRAQ